MREISDITSDLQKSAKELTDKREANSKAEQAQQKAFQEMDAVQVKVSELRNELNEALNLLVPGSLQSGVRQS